MQRKLFLITICLNIIIYSYCQTDGLPDIIISIAEDLSDIEANQEAATIYIERLLELTEDPVKINSADESEISRIFFLTEFQVKVLCDYVRTNGPIKTLYEIAYLPGFDNTVAMMVKPFIVFDISDSFGSVSKRINHAITSNITGKTDSDTSVIEKLPVKMVLKYKLTTGKFTSGFTGEKDAGEQSFFSTGKAPDFLSAYLLYEGTGIIRKIIAGDFSVRLGQGTNINSGIYSGLSLTTSEFMAGKNEIRQYTSTDENNFFRGAAVGLNLKFADVLLFYSQNRIDATLNYNDDSIAVSVKNLYNTGLHDSPSALLKKDVLTETSSGANISMNINNLRVGLTWSENRFSLPFINESNELRDLYSFTGNRSMLLSSDYKWLYKTMIFFGEFTLSQSGGKAYIQGIKLKPDSRLSMNLLFRHYDANFHTLHGNAQVSGSETNNETGITGNFLYELAKNYFLSAGADIYNSPWLKYNCDAPSWGQKYEFKSGYYPSDNLNFEVYYNYRAYMLNSDNSALVNKPEKNISRSVKAIVKYSPEPNINLGTRVEYKFLSPSGKSGLILSQDLNLSFNKIPVRLWLRWCFYDTDGYDARIYVYENDLVNTFSVPAFYDEGSRSYFMISWKIWEKTELRFKYGILTKIGNSGIASDRQDIKFQLRMSF